MLITVNHLNAKINPYNTYRWNRKNIIKGNDKESRKPWYEWWYLKMVIPEQDESFYFIYGIINPWDNEYKLGGTKSYVGMGDFKQKEVIENDYKLDQFTASYVETLVEIGNSALSDQHIYGSVKADSGMVSSWDFSINNKWSFNGEGWALSKNITNIKWYPIKADASCTGHILRGERLVQFVDVPCYQDRNWGKSLPQWWTWIVSNHFVGHADTAIAIGGGKPLIFNRSFSYASVVVGLKHKGIEYSFRPHDLNKVKIDIKFGKWKITASDSKYKLEIEAYADAAEFLDLPIMSPQGLLFHDYETLTGKLTVKIFKKSLFKGWNLVETLHSNHTGIEYGSFDEIIVDKIDKSIEF